MIKYFKTGERKYFDSMFIEGNVLQCITDYPKKGDITSAAIKVDGYIVINGDDVGDGIGDFDDVVDDMQDYSDNEITTSFVCLKNAGIDLQKIKVIEITKDLDVHIKHGEKGFDEFDSILYHKVQHLHCILV